MSHHGDVTRVSIDLLRKYDRPGPRYTSYPTAPVWSEAVGETEYAAALTAAAERAETPLSIYCHIPFCCQRCWYCGCTTVVTHDHHRLENYVETISAEVVRTAALLGKRRTVSQWHFGGGTPTTLDVARLQRLIETVKTNFELQPGVEMSIEIDPRVTTDAQLEYLAEAGFNRISMGIQDFDPEVQAASGRIQPVGLVEAMLSKVRRYKYNGINFDLIYGLPRQSSAGFADTIDRTIAMRPDRVAVYSFAYLPKVRPNQAMIDPTLLPDTETKYRLFASAVERFTAAGYVQIGMDHFALPDDELAVAQRDGRLQRNFMGYTVQSAPEMLGFGMSSIGYVDNAFFQNSAGIDSYTTAIERGGFAVYRGMRLSQDDLIRQYLITQLMCNFTLRFDKLATRFGVDYDGYFSREKDQLGEFVEDGFLEVSGEGLAVTPVGRTFVRNIAMVFDAHLGESGSGERPTYSRTV